ncbi:hypothetical protein DERP_009198 [Dermatophagoides pteronyssinus]|uniref:Uncharacterized protein n=1 Tax=Dermatophagoides pteronyssinus TaxID=6956 RepID=A0ABQ8JQT4_DERPT|nr:hypothetical protein DERP_009198 [Dermatophagoides pteronyssinus]
MAKIFESTSLLHNFEYARETYFINSSEFALENTQIATFEYCKTSDFITNHDAKRLIQAPFIVSNRSNNNSTACANTCGNVLGCNLQRSNKIDP